MYIQTYPQHVLPALNNPNENTGKNSAVALHLLISSQQHRRRRKVRRRLGKIRDGDGRRLAREAGANGSSGSAAHRIKRRTVAAAQPRGIYPTPINIST